jgi:hypothetical protein
MQTRAIQRRNNELKAGDVTAAFPGPVTAVTKPIQPDTVASNMESISNLTGEVKALATEVANAIAGAAPDDGNSPTGINNMDLLYETSMHIGKLEALREELMRAARALGIR